MGDIKKAVIMKFDQKLLDLSRTIHQTSIMSHSAQKNPVEQIDKIKSMIREFIRNEVVPYELCESEKKSFIMTSEWAMTQAIMAGHRARDGDEFQKTRTKIAQFRKDLKI